MSDTIVLLLYVGKSAGARSACMAHRRSVNTA